MIGLDSYESLERLLLEFRSWPPTSDGQYDPVGIAQLMQACIANLRVHHVEGDLQAIATVLDDADREFLRTVLNTPPQD